MFCFRYHAGWALDKSLAGPIVDQPVSARAASVYLSACSALSPSANTPLLLRERSFSLDAPCALRLVEPNSAWPGLGYFDQILAPNLPVAIRRNKSFCLHINRPPGPSRHVSRNDRAKTGPSSPATVEVPLAMRCEHHPEAHHALALALLFFA